MTQNHVLKGSLLLERINYISRHSDGSFISMSCHGLQGILMSVSTFDRWALLSSRLGASLDIKVVEWEKWRQGQKIMQWTWKTFNPVWAV